MNINFSAEGCSNNNNQTKNPNSNIICRPCKEKDEAMDHIISEWSKNKYLKLTMNNAMTKVATMRHL